MKKIIKFIVMNMVFSLQAISADKYDNEIPLHLTLFFTEICHDTRLNKGPFFWQYEPNVSCGLKRREDTEDFRRELIEHLKTDIEQNYLKFDQRYSFVDFNAIFMRDFYESRPVLKMVANFEYEILFPDVSRKLNTFAIGVIVADCFRKKFNNIKVPEERKKLTFIYDEKMGLTYKEFEVDIKKKLISFLVDVGISYKEVNYAVHNSIIIAPLSSNGIVGSGALEGLSYKAYYYRLTKGDVEGFFRLRSDLFLPEPNS